MNKKEEQETSSAVLYHNTATVFVRHGKVDIKLTNVSLQLASGLLCIYSILILFIVNSYNLNFIHTQYLKLLKKLKCFDGLPQSLFVQLFEDKYSSLVVLYFSYISIYSLYPINHDFIFKKIDGPIRFNDFFQFLVFFVFFDPLQLTPVLLSMIGVQSNIFIKFDQIQTFFRCFGLSDDDYAFYLEILEQYTGSVQFAPNDQIPLKLFSQSLDQSRFVVDKVIGFRKNLINICYSENEYLVIQNRLYYYYEIYVVPPVGHLLPPKEGCFNKLKRIIKNQPDPYKYDYLKETPNYDLLHQLIKSYRTKFGYSIRSSSASSSVNYFTHHKSGKNQNNSTIDAAVNEQSASPSVMRRSISKHNLISSENVTPDGTPTNEINNTNNNNNNNGNSNTNSSGGSNNNNKNGSCTASRLQKLSAKVMPI